MPSKKQIDTRVASLSDEADRLLAPDLVMERISILAIEMGIDLSEDEKVALWKHAEASRAIYLVTMLLDSEERAEKIMELSDAIFDYTDDVSEKLMTAATATLQ